MEDVRHLSVQATGAWYAVPYILMLVFAIASSLFSDRIVRRAPFIAIGPILAAVLLLVATHMTAVTPALLLISLGLACNGFVVPNISASLQQFAQPSNIGVVYGVALATQTLASAIGTYIIGVSFDVGFIYMEAFAILGGLATVVLVVEGL
jgi:MFS family permease